MAQTESAYTGFSAAQDEDLVRYRSLSALAVVALCLGILSLVALYRPLLWLVPALAVIFAVIALRKIARREQELSGRWMALVGLFLALFFGAWAVGKQVTYRQMIAAEAKKHSDSWLELVRQGDLYKAYELHLEHFQRQSKGTNFLSRYGPFPEIPDEPSDVRIRIEQVGTMEGFQMFWVRSPQVHIREHGKSPDSQLQYHAHGAVQREYVADMRYHKETITLNYTFDYTEDGVRQSLPFNVVMQRRWFTETAKHWSVYSIYEVPE